MILILELTMHQRTRIMVSNRFILPKKQTKKLMKINLEMENFVKKLYTVYNLYFQPYVTCP